MTQCGAAGETCLPGGSEIDSKGSTVLDQLSAAVHRTVAEFQNHPVDFLSERDIQSWLFIELRQEMSNLRYRFEVGDAADRFGYIPDINPVKTEYQLDAKGSGPRVDIAVLSEVQNPRSNIWRQPCRIAIEIKLWQPGGPYLVPWDDVKKLRFYRNARDSNLPFTGIAMLFVHPVHEKWQKGMPDIEHWLENKVDIVPGSGFPSDGIAFHLVTPQNWKRFSIPEASAVLSLFGESSEASSDGILLGHASSEYHRRTDR